MNYKALAYYYFIPIENPHEEIAKQHRFFEGRDAAGRIYISEEGINGQLSGISQDISDYIEWMQSDSRFKTLRLNIHACAENIFPRMTIKYRKQLVALDRKVDLTNRGAYLAPEQWKKILDDPNEQFLMIDVRNRYEWEIGHFEQASLPPLDEFREFPDYAEDLAETLEKNTKILMYCTGGIRCEIFSSLLKEKGFEQVFQLEGGVINYGLKEGKEHWKGKLFVFDDRLAIPIDGQDNEAISYCIHCQKPSDIYYNCANMDCNALFLSCHSCIVDNQGCCTELCRQAPRLRPYDDRQGNKPFRRKHLLTGS